MTTQKLTMPDTDTWDEPHLSTRWDTAPLDLRAYLDRIGFDEPPPPTLESLRDLQDAHLETFPFDGLNAYLGLGVPLDIESLQTKMVRGQRGGYCHEQNILFGTVLERLGFQVTGRNARMLMGADPHVVTGRGHAIVSVVIDGTDYHVDVGIGNVGPRGPVPLLSGAHVSTGPWQYRMDSGELGHWVLRYHRPSHNDWFTVVQFTEERYYRSDYEDHNFFASTHKTSPFTQQPVVTYNGAEVRRALSGLTLNTYLPNGEKDSRKLAPEEVPETLRAVFNVHLPAAQERELVTRLENEKNADTEHSHGLISD